MSSLNPKTVKIMRKKILRLLRCGNCMTSNKLAAKLVRSWGFIDKLMLEMESEGIVEKFVMGKAIVWRRTDGRL